MTGFGPPVANGATGGKAWAMARSSTDRIAMAISDFATK